MEEVKVDTDVSSKETKLKVEGTGLELSLEIDLGAVTPQAIFGAMSALNQYLELVADIMDRVNQKKRDNMN